ncbi:hypothetical protein IWT25_00771 [Secundilactobacillus pentosiphilus]|uniref:LysM domain-containing protein n=1 Tax=Secundilactobacillus pentosiphilus TaxID=1714682 RepID=A0A1Z5IUN3_9LACO|nr:LysM domain-containing protein [Secundilactobacillus pentosiphilus]GAX05465.1 hypothetical protein IWT25_00771 [Secundilactobacillus pentosiphilus]
MATPSKSLKSAVKHFSSTTISSKIKKWDSAVSASNKQIRTTQSKIDKYQDQLDKANDELGKKNGYNDAKAAYNEVDKKLAAAKKSLSTAKDKSKIKSLKREIKTLTGQKKDAYKNLLKKSSSESKTQKSMTEALNKLEVLKKNLKKEKGSKTSNASYASLYKKEQEKRKAAAYAALQKKNAASIMKKIAAQEAKVNAGNAGKTSIYLTNKSKSTVFFFGEKEPSETDSNDVDSHAVDNGDPRSRYSRRNSKELTGTYFLFGKDFADIDKKFDAFQKWQRYGYEVTVRGFSRWGHAQISQVVKGTVHQNAVEVSITFNYAKKGEIMFKRKKAKSGSSKSKNNNKGSKTKSTGSSKGKHKYVTVRSSRDTMWAISVAKKVSLRTIEKLNSKLKPTQLHIGDKIYYS